MLLWLLLLNKAVSAREQYLVIELWCAVSWGCAAKIPITIGGGEVTVGAHYDSSFLV